MQMAEAGVVFLSGVVVQPWESCHLQQMMAPQCELKIVHKYPEKAKKTVHRETSFLVCNLVHLLAVSCCEQEVPVMYVDLTSFFNVNTLIINCLRKSLDSVLLLYKSLIEFLACTRKPVTHCVIISEILSYLRSVKLTSSGHRHMTYRDFSTLR